MEEDPQQRDEKVPNTVLEDMKEDNDVSQSIVRKDHERRERQSHGSWVLWSSVAPHGSH